MNIQANLWYSKIENQYYMIDIFKICPKCEESLIDKGMYCLFVRFVGRRFNELVFYCNDCAKSVLSNPFAILEIKNYALLSSFKPKDSILVLENNNTLSNAKDILNVFCSTSSGLTVFDTDEINKTFGGATMDNTLLANRSDQAALTKDHKDPLQICKDKDEELLALEDLNAARFGRPYDEDDDIYGKDRVKLKIWTKEELEEKKRLGAV